MLNNFIPHRYFVTVAQIRLLSGQISELLQNGVTNDNIDQKRDMA